MQPCLREYRAQRSTAGLQACHKRDQTLLVKRHVACTLARADFAMHMQNERLSAFLLACTDTLDQQATRMRMKTS